MTPAQEMMIAALKLCPCCRVSRDRVDTPQVNVAAVSFHCGSSAQVDAEGMATVSIGCPYPMDDALFEIQKGMLGSVIAIPPSTERVRASILAELDAATLPPLSREALVSAYLPFAELLYREKAKGSPGSGNAIADAAIAVAAAVIGHLHMNTSTPGVHKVDAVQITVGRVLDRVLRSIENGVVLDLGDDGRMQ